MCLEDIRLPAFGNVAPCCCNGTDVNVVIQIELKLGEEVEPPGNFVEMLS